MATPLRGFLLDAFGTLVKLVPPAPVLAGELRDEWDIECAESDIERAFRLEISYYKAHHLEGFDAPTLADLRLRCSGVLHQNLPESVREKIDPVQLLPAFLRSLRFRPYSDTVAALVRIRSAGLSLAVVSNWDVSLGDTLERCGISRLVDRVVSSAEVGAAKPEPLVFERALDMLGLPPSSVLHVGDTPVLDVTGARAAGISPILIQRRTTRAPGAGADVPVITTLAELAHSLPE